MASKGPITLIVPPSVFLADERVFVHLGILRIAAVLEQMEHPVTVIDLSGVENYCDVVRDYLQANLTRIVGITATTAQMPAVEQITTLIRDTGQNIKIVLGGPHVTSVNAAKKNEMKRGIVSRAHTAFSRLSGLADVLVAGDGEGAIVVAIEESSPALIDADDPGSALFLRPEQLGELPLPARHLVDIHSYRYLIDERPSTSLIAQLGCPYGCGYCSGRLSPSFRRVRVRNSESVVNEVRHIYEQYGFTGFQFYDDELNVNPSMLADMRSIGNLQEELGTEFRLRGFLKANLVTEEQIVVLKEVGFRQVCIGFESGSERILRNINKKATRAQNTRCMELAHKYGLQVKAYMSIGHPGENEDTVRQTHDWLLEVQPYDFDCTIISTFPGTPYYDYAREHPTRKGIWIYETNGDRLYAHEIDYVKTAEYFKGMIEDGYRSYVFTDALSEIDLVQLRDSIERDVREKLGIPFYKPATALRYDHSMGQIPFHILRKSPQ